MSKSILTKETNRLYTWCNLELSQVQPYKWILAFNGSSKPLPCGHDSLDFVNLNDARRYLEIYGYSIGE